MLRLQLQKWLVNDWIQRPRLCCGICCVTLRTCPVLLLLALAHLQDPDSLSRVVELLETNDNRILLCGTLESCIWQEAAARRRSSHCISILMSMYDVLRWWHRDEGTTGISRFLNDSNELVLLEAVRAITMSQFHPP